MITRSAFNKRLDRARAQLLGAAGRAYPGLPENCDRKSGEKNFEVACAKLERFAMRFTAAALDARLRELDPSGKDGK